MNANISKMYSFLIVGFGAMGCRHTQSIISSYPNAKICVVEPSKEIFEENCKKINVRSTNIERYSDIDSLKGHFDFCVVATSAEPRFKIVKHLFDYGIKNYLLEKVVFQSKKQFSDLEKLTNMTDVNIYCNFVSRYFPNYIEIKKEITDKPIKIIVSGGDFGLACNSLHYIDLFQYLRQSSPYIISHNLKENFNGNRRGFNYKEIQGSLHLTNTFGDSLSIISDLEKGKGLLEVTIINGGTIHVLNENTFNHTIISNSAIEKKEFQILRTSELTGKIVNDFYNNTILLPKISETKHNHIEIFKVFNETFKLSESDNCPIT
jgi:hypothetical protein